MHGFTALKNITNKKWYKFLLQFANSAFFLLRKIIISFWWTFYKALPTVVLCGARGTAVAPVYPNEYSEGTL